MVRLPPPISRSSSPRLPRLSFVNASSLHIGAAAAAASLRRDLVETGAVLDATFDRAFSVARLTPGTNLLALNVLLGHYFAGWRGALQALAIATVIPSIMACVAAVVYVRIVDQPVAAAALGGARAGALAVVLWAVVRLVRPQLERQVTRGTLLAIAALTIALTFRVPPIMLLLLGGGVGALFLRGEP
jgi:chromate transporter